MRKQIISFLTLLMFLASCERYEDAGIDLPYKNKLVAVTFLQEGSDSITLMLTRTLPVFEATTFPGTDMIAGADVYVQTSRETLKLVFDETLQQYSGILTAGVLLPGETCRISVSQNNDEVSGSTVIPADITPLVAVKADSILENEIYWPIYNVRYKIQEPGTHNLRFSASVVYSDSTTLPLLAESGELSTPLQKINSGEEALIRFRHIMISSDVHPVRIEIYSQLCNDDYTKYHQSINVNQSSGFGTDGAEPVIVYSNMSNRIGVTAAYNILPVISLKL